MKTPDTQNSQSQALLTIPEAAERLRLTEKALRQIMHRGEGPPIIRISPRNIRIAVADLKDWLNERRDPV